MKCIVVCRTVDNTRACSYELGYDGWEAIGYQVANSYFGICHKVITVEPVRWSRWAVDIELWSVRHDMQVARGALAP